MPLNDVANQRKDLGYDVPEIERNYDKSGITGEVGRFAIEGEQYPQYTIVMSENSKVNNIQVQALKGMFSTTNITGCEGEADLSIAVYIEKDGNRSRLGKILPRQVKAFLTLFEGCQVMGKLDANTDLEGDKLFVLSE